MNALIRMHNIERKGAFICQQRKAAKQQMENKLVIARTAYSNAVRTGVGVVEAYSTLLAYENEKQLKGF